MSAPRTCATDLGKAKGTAKAARVQRSAGGRAAAWLGAHVVGLACVGLAAALVGVAAAFITRMAQGPSHTFEFGDVDISIDATTPAAAERVLSDMLPNEPQTFDPTITVESTSQPAYLFAKVNMPQGDIDGAGPGGDVDLFETNMDTTPATDGHWQQVVATSTNGADVVSDGTHSTVYAWVDGAGKMRAVSANGTAAVFSQVVYLHQATVQLAEDATISVDAYAIQANYLGADHAVARASTPEEVWDLVCEPTGDPLGSS